MKEKKKEEQDSMWELELKFHVDFSPHQQCQHMKLESLRLELL